MDRPTAYRFRAKLPYRDADGATAAEHFGGDIVVASDLGRVAVPARG
jgi:hypothetical protein